MLLKGDTNSTKVGGFLTTLWFKLQAHKGNATEVAKIWSKKNINFLQFSQSLSGLFQGQLFGIIKERRSLLTLKLLSLSFIFWVLILIQSYWSHPQKFGPQINRSVYFASTGSGLWRPLLLHAIPVEVRIGLYLPRRSRRRTCRFPLRFLSHGGCLQSRDVQTLSRGHTPNRVWPLETVSLVSGKMEPAT